MLIGLSFKLPFQLGLTFYLQKSCLDVKPEIKFPFPPQVTFKYSSPTDYSLQRNLRITHFSNYSLTDSLLFPQLIFPLKAEFCLYGLRQVLYLQSPTSASWLLGLRHVPAHLVLSTALHSLMPRIIFSYFCTQTAQDMETQEPVCKWTVEKRRHWNRFYSLSTTRLLGILNHLT